MLPPTSRCRRLAWARAVDLWARSATMPLGRFCAPLWPEYGVNSDALLSVPLRTTLALVAKNSGGIPDFVFYRGADAAFRPEDVPEDLVAQSRFLCAGLTSMTVEPARSAVYAAVEMAQRHGVLICIDPNLRPSSWPSLGDALDTAAPHDGSGRHLKINDEEARLFAGSWISTRRSPPWMRPSGCWS